MKNDPQINIDYASKKSRISNYWKYYQGQSEQLKELNVYDKKVTIEKKFEEFVNKNKNEVSVHKLGDSRK